VLQVAEGGRWERAQVSPLPVPPDDVNELLESAARVRGLAVEVLWPGPPIVFVGAGVGRFDELMLRGVAANDGRAPSQVLETLAGGSLGPASRAELGVVNAWYSVGPLPLALDASVLVVGDALLGRADLMWCRHPVALEVTHVQPREGWWAIEVSAREGATHVVDVEKVVEVLRGVTEGR
jgi:hypothetical protein